MSKQNKVNPTQYHVGGCRRRSCVDAGQAEAEAQDAGRGTVTRLS